MDRSEPFVHLVEPPRVDLKPLLVVPKAVHGFLQLNLRTVERVQNFTQCGVVIDQRGQFRMHCRHTRQRRGIVFRERLQRKLCSLDQTCRVRKPGLLGTDVAPFFFTKRQLLQLADLPFQLFALTRDRRHVALGRNTQPLCRLPRRPGVGHLPRQLRHPGIGIEQLTLRLRFGQGLVFMLAMNIDQQIAEFAKLLNRHRPAVDPGARSARNIDHPSQQTLTVFGQFAALQELMRRSIICQQKLGADFGLGTALPYQPGVGPLAQNHGQRVDHD